jgi:DNA modification methylase
MKPYYQDDACTIYHGDCREILPSLPKADLVLTDPPYNIGYHYEGYSDDLTIEDYQRLLRDTLSLPCCVIHYAEALCALAWTLEELPQKIVAWVYASNTARQWRGIAWWGIKPDFTLDGQDYRNPTDSRIALRILNGERARLYDWWEVDQVKNVGEEKTEHPCQIPLAVIARVLRITPCGTILDPFMGSGTTLRAAKDLGRKAIGVEIEEKYCEIAAKRLAQEVLNFA